MFVADAMLGKLARWLRLLGFDTLYDARVSDRDLVRLALTEGRWLLTKDRPLAASRATGLKGLLVLSERHTEQVSQVLRATGNPPPDLFGRCPVCNTPLLDVSAQEAAGEGVPTYVLATAAVFRRCPGCRHVYWPGTHREKIVRTLRAAGIVIPEV